MKKFVVIALILFLIFSSGIAYLNKVILPQKIKSLIVSTLREQTGKDVTLESLEFSIFKGLILRNLVISDKPQGNGLASDSQSHKPQGNGLASDSQSHKPQGNGLASDSQSHKPQGNGLASDSQSHSQNVILSTRQASCSIFIWPILKKEIIIPSISLKTPYIFLERRLDKSFNLQDLFASAGAPSKKSGFRVSVFKISVLSGNVVFQDDTLVTKFRKEIKNIQFSLYLGLPATVKFNFKGEMPHKPQGNGLASNSQSHKPPVLISAFGQYKILKQELLSNIEVKNLSVEEFQVYYNNPGDLASGLIDLQAQINLKDQVLQANIAAKGDNLVLEKNKLKAKLNSRLQTKIDYNLQTKKLAFDGACDILQADISGVEWLGEINNLRGKFTFNQRSLFAESLKAELLGLPFEVKLGIKDFNTPVLSINTDLNLSILPAIAKERFNFNLINSASGKAVLSIKAHPDENGTWVVQGDLSITGAGLKLDKQNNLVEDIASVIKFSQQGFSWKDTKFKSQGINYQSNGMLSNFSAPSVKLKLFSQDLSLAADFDLLGKKIKIAQLKGKYLDSQFLVSGDVDNSDSANLQVDLRGKINLELSNLSRILEKQYPAIKSMRPAGQLDAQFNLSGNPSNFKSCYLQAKFAGNNFSLYGLNAQSLSLDFLQDQKIAKIPAMRVAIYDGLIEGSGGLDLDTDNLAYQLKLKADGIKLEKLKMDTPSKNENISGTLFGELKLNGSSGDLSKLSGAGSFGISQGRLWGLNLLQGVGKLLFTKDLESIELSECTCVFLIKDKFVYTDKLELKGNIANLSGPLKIGFDSSLEGSLNVDILSEMVPVSGTFKDIATAIIGESGKFGVIKLSGTLGEPKYSFKPQVTNIIKGLTDLLFGK